MFRLLSFILVLLTLQCSAQIAGGGRPVVPFTGDTGTGGVQGLVPAPAAGDAAAGKVLGAGGGWVASGTGDMAKATYDTDADGAVNNAEALGGTTPTAAGLALLDDASAADQRTTLGLGTAATSATGDFATAGHNHTGTYQPADSDLTTWAGVTPSANGQSLVSATDYAAMRGLLSLGTAALAASTDFAAAGHNHTGTYQPADADLTAIAGLTSAADTGLYFTGAGTAATYTLTTLARSLLDDATTGDMQTTLGLAIGTNVQAYDADLTTWAGVTPSENGKSLVASTNYASMRGLLDLEVGTDIQAYDADLGNIAAISGVRGDVLVFGASGWTRVGTGTAGQVFTANGAGADPSWAAAAGGVTGFTSALNTASPNDATNVSSLAASGGTTNQHAALVPKGTGGVLAAIPDGANTGGNNRGAYSVDWQTRRTNAAHVASGDYSAIGGGMDNTASADYSTVAGGNANTASRSNSAVGGGGNNTASGSSSTVAGGSTNTASGLYSSAGGGYSNTASGTNATVPGGRGGAATLYGELAHGAGSFLDAGDAQRACLVSRAATSSAVATTLCLDGSSVLPVLTAERTWFALVRVSARQDDGKSGACWGQAVIERTGSTTRLVSSDIGVPVGDTEVGAFTLTLAADDTNDALTVSVTPANATATRWVAVVELVEVGY